MSLTVQTEAKPLRRCASCRKPFPHEHVGHNVTRDEWYCSPKCHLVGRRDEVDTARWPCPKCRANLVPQSGGGVKCSSCDWWECY